MEKDPRMDACHVEQIETLLTEFDCHFYGIGSCDFNYQFARHAIVQARALGSRFAKAWCEMMLTTGERGAILRLREVASDGDMRAQSVLGEYLANGHETAQNYEEAVELWMQSSTYAHSQYWLGRALFYGTGVTQNVKEAAKWWLKAAEQGHFSAQVYLARSFRHGYGVAKDLSEALNWYRLAHYRHPYDGRGLVCCLEEVATELIRSGERVQSADYLWEAIEVLNKNRSARHDDGRQKSIANDFWCKTVVPLRLMAARAVVEAGESRAGLQSIFHEGIVDEVELVRLCIK